MQKCNSPVVSSTPPMLAGFFFNQKTKEHTMIFAVLLAAGSGSRLKNAAIPKQYLELHNEPILCITVKKFLQCESINKIIVVVAEKYKAFAEKILAAHIPDSVAKPISLCIGGNTRQESLFNAANFIKDSFSATRSDIVVSHDVARPFVSIPIIQSTIDVIQNCDAVTTAISAIDTIIIRDSLKDTHFSYPDRENIYQIQTPQTFRLYDYLDLCEKSSHEDLQKLTDATSLFYNHARNVQIVKGSQYNFKITTQFDYDLAKYLSEKDTNLLNN